MRGLYIAALRRLPAGSQQVSAARGFASAQQSLGVKLPAGAVLLMTFESSTIKPAGGHIRVRNLSGAGNDGFLTGAKPAQGQAGDALSFNGANQHVDCRNSVSLNFSETMTICAWAKPVGFRDGAIDIIGKSSRKERGFVLRHEFSLPDFALADGLAWHAAKGSTPSKENAWRHLVGTYDGKTQRLYVDGQQVTELTMGAPVAQARSDLRIGGSTYDKACQFIGAIDEVAIFNRCLAEDEVQTLYYLGLAGQPLAK